MAGHDETFVDFRIVEDWITNHPRKDELVHPYTHNQLLKLPNNKIALGNWLTSLSYEFYDENYL